MATAQPKSLAEDLADASRVVARVAAGESLNSVRARRPLRPAVLDLVYGCLRDFGRGDLLIDALTNRAAPTPAVRALLLVALRGLHAGRAEHVLVSQAVEAAGRLRVGAAKGFVNAVLRNYLRRRNALNAQIARSPIGRYCHPQWWVDRVRNQYPDEWERALDAGNQHPPMTLRVNVRRTGVADYLHMLAGKGIDARQVGPVAIRVGAPLPVEEIPGFADGAVSVQDAGAQLAAPLLAAASGQRVLDACAAPGGKAAHILELADVDLTALDIDPVRVDRVRATLARLGLAATILQGDATEPAQWANGRTFERVLLDAPCTASGVARRYPDVKWLRRERDIAGFATLQRKLVSALWRVLEPGGKLLYVTCSVFGEENDAVVEWFLERQSDAARIAVPELAGGQLLPDEEHDGFFYALLGKELG
ncbi:MAG: 16S rRNA (cytosine(967)-C(5))-methyltransferase RsmB [Betaproteobacteria bacterium]|jgi:16S rRNA (cytosine967-C5)-methyltransferase|nr:16S rRNA (cytosine(967)-C(5))-methyltransferase RsmB [Betaproteobacteria bacterium]